MSDQPARLSFPLKAEEQPWYVREFSFVLHIQDANGARVFTARGESEDEAIARAAYLVAALNRPAQEER